MRERGRGRFPVTLIDLSVCGCRVELPSSLPSDTWVWLNISGLETQYAKIVWCHDTFAGLEFAVPLSSMVVDTIVGRSLAGEHARATLKAIASRCHALSGRADPDVANELASVAIDCTVKAIGDELTARFG
jgi:hypothetical protein